MNVEFARTEPAIRACFPVFSELRPHLTEDAFVAQVQRQMRHHGYVLVYVTDGNQIVAAAGYRVAEFLAWGKAFYVDDLITVTSARRQGHGGRLLDWLLRVAKAQGCEQFHLDSGPQRHEAHRLYMSRHLQLASHHFAKLVE